MGLRIFKPKLFVPETNFSLIIIQGILCLTSVRLITRDFHACSLVILAAKKMKKVWVPRCLGILLDKLENNAVLKFLGTFNNPVKQNKYPGPELFDLQAGPPNM